MNEIEKLLTKDRAARIPEAPDLRYTVAAVQRRMRRLGPVRESTSDWWLTAAGGALALSMPFVAWVTGLSPWWLLAPPLSLLVLSPVLVRKGVKRS